MRMATWAAASWSALRTEAEFLRASFVSTGFHRQGRFLKMDFLKSGFPFSWHVAMKLRVSWISCRPGKAEAFLEKNSCVLYLVLVLKSNSYRPLLALIVRTCFVLLLNPFWLLIFCFCSLSHFAGLVPIRFRFLVLILRLPFCLHRRFCFTLCSPLFCSHFFYKFFWGLLLFFVVFS